MGHVVVAVALPSQVKLRWSCWTLINTETGFIYSETQERKETEKTLFYQDYQSFEKKKKKACEKSILGTVPVRDFVREEDSTQWNLNWILGNSAAAKMVIEVQSTKMVIELISKGVKMLIMPL